MSPQRSTARRRTGRNGSVLVEFAFIALAFYLLFAGTIELGRMITTAQAVQNAARVGARELALVPLPATATFRQALADPDVRARIYDERLLAVPTNGGQVPNSDGWPIVNRMLTPLMILQDIGGTVFYQYPGAVVQGDTGEYTVKIPEVVSRAADGSETIRWHEVVEEVLPEEGTGPYSLASTGPERGLVALRINCPYQAATMSAFQTVDASGNQVPIQALDGSVIEENPTGLSFVGQVSDVGPYAGKYGMGKLYALNTEVRPFRRLISAQSLFRREVYK